MPRYIQAGLTGLDPVSYAAAAGIGRGVLSPLPPVDSGYASNERFGACARQIRGQPGLWWGRGGDLGLLVLLPDPRSG